MTDVCQLSHVRRTEMTDFGFSFLGGGGGGGFGGSGRVLKLDV